jgi:hypothetical protein
MGDVLFLLAIFKNLSRSDVHSIDDALDTRALVQASVLLDSKLHFPYT